MVAMVGGWFVKPPGRRGRCLAVAGIGVGTMVMSPLSAALIDRLRLARHLCDLRDRRRGRSARMRTARRPAAWRWCLPSRLASADAWRSACVPPDPPVDVRARARACSCRSSSSGSTRRSAAIGSVQAAVLVGVSSAARACSLASASGRSCGLFGSFRLYRGLLSSSTASASSCGSWPARRTPLLVLFVLVLGVGYGGFVALGPIVISDRMGVAGLGSILGLLYTGPGLGGLIGPPLAGLVDRSAPTPIGGRSSPASSRASSSCRSPCCPGCRSRRTAASSVPTTRSGLTRFSPGSIVAESARRPRSSSSVRVIRLR